MKIQKRPQLLNSCFLLLVVFVLGGCSSGAKIRSDYDHDADFGSYTTYNFMEGVAANSKRYQGFFSQYMVAAIEIEMEKRGYSKSDNPDLLLNFAANFQDKTKVTTSSAPPMGGYYGYRRGYYGAWGGYGYGTETHVSEYTEGTFNIDIVDARRKQLIWEAVGVGRVSDKAFDNLEESVNNGVTKYFEYYPFRAGDPLPVNTKK
jgi:hypothetical protein